MATHSPIRQFRRYGPVRQCIYCGRDDVQLTIEHIVPFSLDGSLELMDSSCRACAAITSSLEEHVSRKMLGNFRNRWSFPSRNKNSKSDTIPIEVLRGEEREVVQLPKQEHPTAVPLIWLKPPNFIDGRPDEEEYFAQVHMVLSPGVRAEDLGGEKLSQCGQINLSIFARVLAKIAHSFAVLRLGVDGFEPFLQKTILTEGTRVFRFVGGVNEIIPPTEPPGPNIHKLDLKLIEHDGKPLVIASVRLFSNWQTHLRGHPNGGTPEYHVIVGRANRFALVRLTEDTFYPSVSRRRKNRCPNRLR